MSRYIVEKLAEGFNFTEIEKEILSKNKRSLSKEERKLFFEKLNVERRNFREYLMERYEQGGSAERDKWAEITIDNLMTNGGEADIVDELAMDVIGRIDIYSELKKRSQQEGKPIKALQGGGGCLFFLTVVLIIITTIVVVF